MKEEINYPSNKEIIEYENSFIVTWFKGKYNVERRENTSSLVLLKEFNTLEAALVFYNDLLEIEENKKQDSARIE